MEKTRLEIEVRNRIFLSVYAYSYEYEFKSLISDEEFDNLSKSINITIGTGNKKLDTFFKNEFSECTGMWICNHPELDKIKNIYQKYFSHKEENIDDLNF